MVSEWDTHMDDLLIFGSNKEEHDLRLSATLQWFEQVGVTLNPSKCVFATDHIKFLGRIVDKTGVQADPAKISANLQMDSPTNLSDLRQFLDMANQPGKFSPRLAEITQPLRELMSSKKTWLWGPYQQSTFSGVKSELSRPIILTLYNLKVPTKVSADASSYGIGAVLLQYNEGQWKPVLYASRSMSDSECRYTQIV